MSIAVPLYGFGTGGGSSLYYSVVCSTTEPAKKEGRIWVKSSVEMTQFEVGNVWSTAQVGTVVVGGVPGGANPTSTNKILDLINTKVAGIPNRLKITPASCKQVQGSAGNGVSVDAYVCHSNTWIQFSSVFSATINITYPAGSTCTCKNGSTTLTAPDTSGTWVCTVSNTGTWTVSCTNGTDSDSAAVTISTDGQTASCTLSYQIVFVNSSGQATKTPTVKRFGTYNSALTFTQNSDRYTVNVQANDGNYGGYSTAYFTVDLTKYSTIKLVINATKANGREYFLTVWKTLGSEYENNKVAQATISSGSKTTVTLDVSGLTGSHVVGLSPHIVNTAICDVYSWIIS